MMDSFWKVVLAGIIATVVGGLILRLDGQVFSNPAAIALPSIRSDTTVNSSAQDIVDLPLSPQPHTVQQPEKEFLKKEHSATQLFDSLRNGTPAANLEGFWVKWRGIVHSIEYDGWKAIDERGTLETWTIRMSHVGIDNSSATNDDVTVLLVVDTYDPAIKSLAKKLRHSDLISFEAIIERISVQWSSRCTLILKLPGSQSEDAIQIIPDGRRDIPVLTILPGTPQVDNLE